MPGNSTGGQIVLQKALALSCGVARLTSTHLPSIAWVGKNGCMIHVYLYLTSSSDARPLQIVVRKMGALRAFRSHGLLPDSGGQSFGFCEHFVSLTSTQEMCSKTTKPKPRGLPVALSAMTSSASRAAQRPGPPGYGFAVSQLRQRPRHLLSAHICLGSVAIAAITDLMFSNSHA